MVAALSNQQYYLLYEYKNSQTITPIIGDVLVDNDDATILTDNDDTFLTE